MKQIVAETKELCRKEEMINSQIIRNLIVIDNQKIHLEMGFSSLFDFCTNELKLSASAAQRKIDAVRLSVAVPNLPEKLQRGEISLANVSQVSKFIRDEKKYAWHILSKTEIIDLVEEVQCRKNDTEILKFRSSKSEIEEMPITENTRILQGGRQVLEIEVGDEFLALLEEFRNLVSHEGFQSKAQLLKKALKFCLDKKHPAYKKERSVRNSALVPRGSGSRYISAALKQKIWKKNQSQCSFIYPLTGKKCNSKFRLQVEHIVPLAFGGMTPEDNLTLLCQAHNLFNASKLGILNHREQMVF